MSEAWGLALLLAVAALGLMLERRAEVWTCYRLRFPRGLTTDDVSAALTTLSGALTQPFITETVATSAGLEHRLRVSAAAAPALRQQLTACLPGLRIEPCTDELSPPVYARQVRASRPDQPLRRDHPESFVSALLSALQPLAEDETLVLQCRLVPAPRHSAVTAEVGSLRLRLAGLVLRVRPARAGSDQRQPAEALFHLTLRLGATAPSPVLARRLLLRPWAVIASLRTAHNRPGLHWLPSHVVARRLARGQAGWGYAPLVAATRELPLLLAWPVGSPQVRGLTLGAARLLAPSPQVPQHGRLLGRAVMGGQRIAQRPEDALRHTHCLGPTGSGKTTVLAQMIDSDLQAGHGLVVIDPLGGLVEAVLDRMPAHRVGDVILLDAADTARPLGFNLLAGADRNPELVTDQVVTVFARLFAAGWGHRSEDLLRASMLTLAQAPGLTLCELPRLLHDASFRAALVGRLDDPVGLGPFWSAFDAMRDGERAQVAAPLLNKLRSLLLRSHLRAIVGQPESSFDLGEVLAERRVLLVSLRKGEIGEDAARLLGSLLFARLWQSVQGRSALPPSARPITAAYIDEFQDVAALPTALADVLAQARGLGLGLVLAHQHLGQLPIDLRDAVLANTRTKLFFQTSAKDATRLARELAPYVTAEDLQNLPAHEAYAALCADGQTLPPLSLATIPPAPATGYATAVRQRSRQVYGRDRASVEAAMRARQAEPTAPTTVGRQRRQG